MLKLSFKQLSSRLAAIAVVLLFASTASAILTFTVANQTSHPLGEVTLHYATGATSVNVLSGGTYVKEVAAEVVAVSINGQTVPKPLIGQVTLATGDTIMVGWSDARVSVIDPDDSF